MLFPSILLGYNHYNILFPIVKVGIQKNNCFLAKTQVFLVLFFTHKKGCHLNNTIDGNLNYENLFLIMIYIIILLYACFTTILLKQKVELKGICHLNLEVIQLYSYQHFQVCLLKLQLPLKLLQKKYLLKYLRLLQTSYLMQMRPRFQ